MPSRRSLSSVVVILIVVASAVALLRAGSDAPAPLASAPDAPSLATASLRRQADARRAQGGVTLEAALSRWSGLYAPQTGFLSQEATAALRAEREAAAAAVRSAVGTAGVEDVLARIRSSDQSREKLLLIEGLGHSGSPEAGQALQAIYAEEARFRLREEALRGLGHIDSAEATAFLVGCLAETDERLSQIAAQALFGEPEALAALSAAIRSDLPMNTRLEAVHSIAAIGTSPAREALEAAATDASITPRVRVYAQRELIRAE